MSKTGSKPVEIIKPGKQIFSLEQLVLVNKGPFSKGPFLCTLPARATDHGTWPANLIGRPPFVFYICHYKSIAMATFDIVSKVDPQTLDNAVNITKKDITNRFDFKDSPVKIELNKKDMKIDLEAESDMKIKQIVDVLISRSLKQGLDPLAFDFSKDQYPSGKTVKQEVPVRNGLKQEDAKKVVKLIKDSGLKVQAQIMDDLVRVTGKKIDDLQEVIQLCRNSKIGVPMQYINMRS